MKKKILVLLRAKDIKKTYRRNGSIWRWVADCRSDYNIEFWGRDLYPGGETCTWGKDHTEKQMLLELKKKIDNFKPDFLYMTHRKTYNNWIPGSDQLPNFSSITVPKIYVEVDTCYYDVNDPWYKQFDILKCRCPWWNNWSKIPLFRWSVPEVVFPTKKIQRSGIYLIGQFRRSIYPIRYQIKRMFSEKVIVKQVYKGKYWRTLQSASCLICPTENKYGDYIPAKLFEYLASGAAVITNCDLKKAGIPELEEYIIRYGGDKGDPGLSSLCDKLEKDFSLYYYKAVPLMREHTHSIRYKELFG